MNSEKVNKFITSMEKGNFIGREYRDEPFRKNYWNLLEDLMMEGMISSFPKVDSSTLSKVLIYISDCNFKKKENQ